MSVEKLEFLLKYDLAIKAGTFSSIEEPTYELWSSVNEDGYESVLLIGLESRTLYVVQ